MLQVSLFNLDTGSCPNYLLKKGHITTSWPQYEYKGGAKYYGDIVDFKAQGRGILTYPDGDMYEGFFKTGNIGRWRHHSKMMTSPHPLKLLVAQE